MGLPAMSKNALQQFQSWNSQQCVEACASMAGSLLELPSAHARQQYKVAVAFARSKRACFDARKTHCAPAGANIARVVCAHHKRSNMVLCATGLSSSNITRFTKKSSQCSDKIVSHFSEETRMCAALHFEFPVRQEHWKGRVERALHDWEEGQSLHWCIVSSAGRNNMDMLQFSIGRCHGENSQRRLGSKLFQIIQFCIRNIPHGVKCLFGVLHLSFRTTMSRKCQFHWPRCDRETKPATSFDIAQQGVHALPHGRKELTDRSTFLCPGLTYPDDGQSQVFAENWRPSFLNTVIIADTSLGKRNEVLLTSASFAQNFAGHINSDLCKPWLGRPSP